MMKRREDLRNVAIIAHVDHGKTTLVDALLYQSGVFGLHPQVEERVMDTLDLEREKGITILSKNTAVVWQGRTINIVDTPGHADFGGQVQRVLKMVDGCLLLVDASEGPLPQTRYVLSNALDNGLSPIVVINKIDRSDARISAVVDEVLELFLDLDASEEQCHFPLIYTNARTGTATLDLKVPGRNLRPLVELIFEKIPAPEYDPDHGLQMQITTLDYSDYVGRIGIGRISHGEIRVGDQVRHVKSANEQYSVRISQLYGFEGLNRIAIQEARAGDIVALAGIENLYIGDTVADPNDPRPLPSLKIDEPTLEMVFSVNTSPFAGREGRYVTSRQIRDRLHKELRGNPALRVDDAGETDKFCVFGRGELQFAILIEMMRREGFEMCIGKPQVLFEKEGEQTLEPYEALLVDSPEDYVGVITGILGIRRGRMTRMNSHQTGWARMNFDIPMRGLIGVRPLLLTATRGTVILHSQSAGYRPLEGEVSSRPTGVIVADREGKVTGYALNNLQDRGDLFVGPGTPVYEGMIVGENSRDVDLVVNIVREKKLTNMRASGSDEHYQIAPPRILSLEEAIAFIDDDELLEVTPKSLRLRKVYLSTEERRTAERRATAAS
jgi:GTP-binding protein